jgi:hypothetical protein
MLHAACPGVHKPFPTSVNFKLGRRRDFSNIGHEGTVISKLGVKPHQIFGTKISHLKPVGEQCLGGRGERGPGLLKIV